MNLPNKLTILRIAMIPLFLVAYFLPYVWACYVATAIFVVAAFTDFLDGYIARKHNLVTDLGKFLDPIADKALAAVALVCIVATNPLAQHNVGETFGCVFLTVCASLMFARDLVVDAMRMIAASKGTVVHANIFGKLKTVFQDITLPLLIVLNAGLFSQQANNLYIVGWYAAIVLMALTTAISVASGVIYLVQNKNVFVSKEGSND